MEHGTGYYTELLVDEMIISKSVDYKSIAYLEVSSGDNTFSPIEYS